MSECVTGYCLYLSHDEAEVLRCFLDHCVKFGADMDPMYEDWDWLKIKRYIQNIAEQLPEAL